ncbi:unnamed protein product [Ambrosiozyma monospora]|uniref:Unnamed protein product n=1 Tax=Ambrosiozyma monospora TaxID=43982 RepID=A0ACB5SV67_AMBMO|nr:unnamed protein product [Ambrosiozyma monospora]
MAPIYSLHHSMRGSMFINDGTPRLKCHLANAITMPHRTALHGSIAELQSTSTLIDQYMSIESTWNNHDLNGENCKFRVPLHPKSYKLNAYPFNKQTCPPNSRVQSVQCAQEKFQEKHVVDKQGIIKFEISRTYMIQSMCRGE